MKEAYDVLYRKCSKKEADKIFSTSQLAYKQSSFKIYNLFHRSHPDKWVSGNRRFISLYHPRGAEPENYRYVVVFYTEPGTLEALKLEKADRKLKRGPRGAYGLPPDLLEWFNRRIRKVEVYDAHTEQLPYVQTEPTRHLLKTREGMFATFMAFSPQYLDNSHGSLRFGDNVKTNRMSWVKTSLLWMLWRSDWGRKKGQERIIEIDVPLDYLGFLFNEAVLITNSTKADLVLCQYDPDRRIIGMRWQKGEEYFVKAGTTVHFGLRGQSLEEYLLGAQYRDIKDITDTIREVLEQRPMHPTDTLYSHLELSTHII